MVFFGIIDRKETITIDGYSKAKTVSGAIADLGRYIEKNISKTEGEAMKQYKLESLAKSETSEGGYFLEVEEVGCATRLNANDEMEYKEANFYVVCRIVK